MVFFRFLAFPFFNNNHRARCSREINEIYRAAPTTHRNQARIEKKNIPLHNTYTNTHQTILQEKKISRSRTNQCFHKYILQHGFFSRRLFGCACFSFPVFRQGDKNFLINQQPSASMCRLYKRQCHILPLTLFYLT